MSESQSTRFSSQRKRPKHSVRQQIVQLQQASEQTLSSLDQSCQVVQQLEDDLDQFMQDYYKEVGQYIEELLTLEEELASIGQKTAHSNDNLRISKQIMRKTTKNIEKRTQSTAIKRDLKQLYREMVKECHPDTAAGQEAIEAMKLEAMQVINDAYARENLAEMWKQYIQLELQQHKGIRGKAKVDMLKQRIDKMQKALDEVTHRREILENSAAHTLMQQAIEMKLDGKSFYDLIISRTLLQIEDLRKKLAYYRMRQQLENEAEQLLKKQAKA